MTVTLLIEQTPLCIRCARVVEGRVTALRCAFPSRRAPILGELYRAKVTGLDKRLGAAYLDLGKGREGFLRRGGKLPEVGRTLIVEVKREAIGGKGADVTDTPVLRAPMASWRLGDEEARPGPLGEREFSPKTLAALTEEGGPGRIDPFSPAVRLMMGLLTSDVETIEVTSPNLKADLEKELPYGFDVRVIEPRDAARQLDEAEEEGLSRHHRLPGGGRLSIDETEALFAVDLDLGTQGGQSKKGAGTKLIGDALAELGRLGPIMGLGGQIVLDIPRGAIAAPKIVRDQITRALKPLGRVSVPAVTPEGLCVVIAPRPRPSLLEVLTEPGRDPVLAGRRYRADTAAAMAFRAAERALEGNRTGTVRLFVTERVNPLLAEGGVARHDLASRFGPRLVVELMEEDAHSGDFHVEA